MSSPLELSWSLAGVVAWDHCWFISYLVHLLWSCLLKTFACVFVTCGFLKLWYVVFIGVSAMLSLVFGRPMHVTTGAFMEGLKTRKMKACILGTSYFHYCTGHWLFLYLYIFLIVQFAHCFSLLTLYFVSFLAQTLYYGNEYSIKDILRLISSCDHI